MRADPSSNGHGGGNTTADAHPAWTFMSTTSGHGANSPSHWTIAVSDSDGTDQTTVYTASGAQSAEQVRFPTWSPNGASISFVDGVPPIGTWYASSTNYGAFSIRAVDVSVSNGVVTGSNARTLCSYTSSDQMVIVEQRWSPTSTVDEVAFIGATPAGWGIYTVPASGGTPTRIYLAPANAEINPGPLEGNAIGWSNDGSQIGFAERDSASDGTVTYALKIINSDGSGTPTTLDEGNHVLGGVQWSHAGSNNQDVLSYYRSSVMPSPAVTDIDLYRISTSGGTPTLIVSHGIDGFWSPNNTELIYTDYTTTSPVMKKVDVASGSTTTLSIPVGVVANYGDWKQP
jgi:hypothetical protein